MKVLLLREIKNLGRRGEIKTVSEGYGLNYLIPQKLAEVVTADSAVKLTARKIKQEKAKKELDKAKRKLARQINGQSYVFKAKADEKGTLYAGLDAAAISQELAKFKIALNADEIVLDSPIKKLGLYEVAIKLAGEKAKIRLEIKN